MLPDEAVCYRYRHQCASFTPQASVERDGSLRGKTAGKLGGRDASIARQDEQFKVGAIGVSAALFASSTARAMMEGVS